jgi:hypothetical protein
MNFDAFMASAAEDERAAAAITAELAAELDKAHRIIGLALNCIEGDARRHFIDDVRAAGLEGEGVTRANERRALLKRVKVQA